MNIDGFYFYTEYSDNDGIRHYAVHKYHPISGIVDMMRDVKDDSFSYPKCDSETWQYEKDHKNYQRYKVISRLNVLDNSKEYAVWDTVADTKVAVFYVKTDADEYCEQKNLDCKYDEAVI